MAGQVRRSAEPGPPGAVRPAAAAAHGPADPPAAAPTPVDGLILNELEAVLLGGPPAGPAPRPDMAATRALRSKPPEPMAPAASTAGPASAAGRDRPAVQHAAPILRAPAKALPPEFEAEFGTTVPAATRAGAATPDAPRSGALPTDDDLWEFEDAAPLRRRPRRFRRGRTAAVATLAVLLAAGGGALLLALGGPGEDDAPTEASAAASTAGTSAVHGKAAPGTAPAAATSATGAEPVRVVEATDPGTAGRPQPVVVADGAAATAAAGPATPAGGDAIPPAELDDAVGAGGAPALRGSATLDEATIAEAAGRAKARLAEAATTPVDGRADASAAAGTGFGAVPAAGAPMQLEPTAGAGATAPAGDGTDGAVADGASADPGGFGVLPPRAPRPQVAAATTAPADAAGTGFPSDDPFTGYRPAGAAAPSAGAERPPAAAPAATGAVTAAATGAAAAAATGNEAAGRPGQIVSAVNMRTGPDNAAATIKVVPAGSRVAVISCSYWCEIEFGGERGWVYKRFVGGDVAATQ